MPNTNKDFEKILSNSSIMVTGGSGSFGQSCVKRLLDMNQVKKIVVYSRGELRQWEMQRRFSQHPNFNRLRFFIGDIRDSTRLNFAMRGIDYLIHAAALKHITVCEYNPTEAVQTNIIGTENIMLAAINNGIRRCVMVSTDKAVSPVNLYGSTKLAAEKIMVAGNNLAGASKTRFSVVRYGNVVGSSGSILPLFLQKIKDKETIPVTDNRMTRFLMRIDQGIEMVLSALLEAKGGEIIIPKAPSVKIMDIVHALHPLKNKAPINNIGIRAGEKLHETLISGDDSSDIYEASNKFICLPSYQTFAEKDPYSEIRKLPIREKNKPYDSLSNNNYINGKKLNNLLQQGAKDFNLKMPF